ncbi:hypothetical protein RB213_009734 [Colletotrichum asianum]
MEGQDRMTTSGDFNRWRGSHYPGWQRVRDAVRSRRR